MKARLFAPKKSLGQHFLKNSERARQIVRYAGSLETGCVVEIGPGTGMLTREILRAGNCPVHAIEKDRRAKISHPRLNWIEQDARTLFPWELGPAPVRVIANLPYYLATHLLKIWLPELHRLSVLVLMFQKQLAERIVASPKTTHRSRLSVLVQYAASSEICMTLGRDEFYPQPKVDSALVRLFPIPAEQKKIPFDSFAQFLSTGFAQRRRKLLPRLAPKTEMLARKNGHSRAPDPKIAPNARPQDLSLAEWIGLYESLYCRAGERHCVSLPAYHRAEH